MKNLFLSLVLVMVGFMSFGQTPTYFGLTLSEQFILDSLKIPYVSIPERNGVNDFGKIEVNERKIAKFNKFFNQTEFAFTPTKNSPSIKFKEFFKNHNFATNDDKFMFELYLNYNLDITGFSKIKLNGSYKSIEIIECRDNKRNTFSAIVLLEGINGKMNFVSLHNYSSMDKWVNQ